MIRGPKDIGRLIRKNKRRQKKAQKEQPDLDPWEIPEELRSKIDRDQEANLRKQFGQFDEDKSGTINKKELATLLRFLGHNPVDTFLEEVLEEVDKDGNGVLSFAEFVLLWYWNGAKESEDQLMYRKAFEFFDKDGNGDVSTQEFKTVMQELGDPLTDEELSVFFEKALGQVDVDADGALQWEEFLAFMKEESANPQAVDYNSFSFTSKDKVKPTSEPKR
ncbi:hypothetical protein CYMTET_44868 [Cymbomonas tetramitiformis]|uniref:EF-hand domain-containing protein n=1 Tax=Cymbomonas tetramitiformis TaxID=36881 RepID=A0AAE0BZC1_9CHLO|nr:hypothetical protein CYMTET_44868 [Cymbomonas tetramitiformis]